MPQFALTEVTAPTEYPITVLELKDHLRIDGSDEDQLLDAYIAAAVEYAQAYTNRQFCTATHDVFYDSFPSDAFYLPRSPLASVTTLKYTDENGTQQTWGSSGYVVDTDRAPARIIPAFDEAWPEIRRVEPGAVEIRIVCGYGAATDVPSAIRHALKLLAGDYYYRREARSDLRIEDNPAVDRLLDSHRVPVWV